MFPPIRPSPYRPISIVVTPPLVAARIWPLRYGEAHGDGDPRRHAPRPLPADRATAPSRQHPLLDRRGVGSSDLEPLRSGSPRGPAGGSPALRLDEAA